MDQIEEFGFYSLHQMECEENWSKTPLRQLDLSPKIQNIGQVKILGSV